MYCAYCGEKAYYFCGKCFDYDEPTAACCSTNTGRDCFARHIAGEKPIHTMRRKRPPLEPTRQSPRRNAQARTGAAADGEEDEEGELAPRRL